MYALWENTIRRLGEVRGIERLAPHFTMLMVLLLAYSLAVLSWKVMPAPNAGENRPPPSQGASAVNSRTSKSSHIVEWHLFGHAQPQNQSAPRPVEAPDTNLNFILRGVVFSDDQTVAHAIIAAGSNESQYTVGAKLPGNVELKEIHADRVVLLHNGRYETLRLPREEDLAGTSAPLRQPTPAPAPISPSTFPNLQEIREELLQNPQSFMDLMQVSPVNQDGAFMGFRVAPGRKRMMLQQLGLQEGDIITSVNGINLDDPAKGLEVLTNLRTADTVAVTVLRQGNEESLTLQVK